MIERIRLFSKSGSEIQVGDEEHIALIGDRVVMAMLEKPTREEALKSCGLGRKAHWAFPGGNGVENGFVAIDIIDELLLLGTLDDREHELLDADASCSLDAASCRRIIRLGQEAGLWIRAFEYRGKGLAFANMEKFDPMKHGIAWLGKRELDKLFKSDHKAADQEMARLLARISEAEQAEWTYAIYVGRGKKLGDKAWQEPEKLARITAGIDQDDIEDELERLTPESVAGIERREKE